MKRLFAILLAMVALVAVAGCGGKKVPSADDAKSVLVMRGINIDANHNILALKKTEDMVTRSQSSFGGFFFLVLGGGGGSSSSETKREAFIGFVVQLNDGTVGILEFPAAMFDFRLKAGQKRPVAKFSLSNSDLYWDNGTDHPGKEGILGNTAILQKAVRRIVVTLSPEQFSEDIAILKYALASNS